MNPKELKLDGMVSVSSPSADRERACRALIRKLGYGTVQIDDKKSFDLFQVFWYVPENVEDDEALVASATNFGYALALQKTIVVSDPIHLIDYDQPNVLWFSSVEHAMDFFREHADDWPRANGGILYLGPGRYFAVVASVIGVGPDRDSGDDVRQDWVGAVWRDEGEDAWTVAYRFRYYADEKVWDSNDRQFPYAYKIPSSTSEEDIVRSLVEIADDLAEHLGTEAHVIRPRTTDQDEVVRLLSAWPWIHLPN